MTSRIGYRGSYLSFTTALIILRITRDLFSLQRSARWIKGETIYFNSRNFCRTYFREVTDSQNLWDLFSQMVRLIFTNYQMGRNLPDKFLRIKNFKKYESYFTNKMFEKDLWKSYIFSKDAGIRHAFLLKMSLFHRCFLNI